MLSNWGVRLAFEQIQLARRIRRNDFSGIEPKQLMKWSSLEISQTQYRESPIYVCFEDQASSHDRRQHISLLKASYSTEIFASLTSRVHFSISF